MGIEIQLFWSIHSTSACHPCCLLTASPLPTQWRDLAARSVVDLAMQWDWRVGRWSRCIHFPSSPPPNAPSSSLPSVVGSATSGPASIA